MSTAYDLIALILLLVGFSVIYWVGWKHGELYSEFKKKSTHEKHAAIALHQKGENQNTEGGK